MASEVSYFIIFGIICFANAKPYRQDSYESESQHDLNKLMELLKQGNENNIMLNHHEDHPGTHHEDTIQLTYKGRKENSRYNNDNHHNEESYQGLHGKNLHNLNLLHKNQPENSVEDVRVSESLNNIFKSLTLNGDNNFDNRNINQGDQYNGNRALNLRCNSKGCRSGRDRDDNDKDDNDRDNNDRDNNARDAEIVIMQNDKNGDNRETLNVVRCVGDRCERIRDDDDASTLLCIGDSCSRNNIDVVNGITERCIGDRCSRDTGNDRDDRDNRHRHKHNIRDYDRDDRNNDKENRNDDRDNQNDDRLNLRCSRGRCGRHNN